MLSADQLWIAECLVRPSYRGTYSYVDFLTHIIRLMPVTPFRTSQLQVKIRDGCDDEWEYVSFRACDRHFHAPAFHRPIRH